MANATVMITRWTGITGSTLAKHQIDSGHTRANSYDGHSAGTPGVVGTSTANGSPGGDVASPVQIPQSGTYYSYWVSTRLMVTVPPVNSLSNIRWYTSGSNNLGTGVDCIFAEAQCPANTYSNAQGTPGTSGTVLTQANWAAGSGTLLAAPASPWQYNSNVPYGPIQFYGWVNQSTALVPNSSGVFPAADSVQVAGMSGGWSWGNFIVYQFTVTSTAVPGPSGVVTFFYKFDET